MKNTLVFSLLSAALCMTLCAQPAPVPATGTAKAAPTKAPRIVDPATRSNLLAKTGGIVQSPTEGPAILFLNTQTVVPFESLVSIPEQIQKTLKLPVVFQTRASEAPVSDVLKALENKNTAAVVVIADSAGYPSLLIAPESRWALVNVASLRNEGLSKDLLAERTQKEVWRAFGYMMGAAHSSFEFCLLQSVLSVSDLDALKAKTLCPEPFNKILDQAKRLGITPIRMTSYRKAVEEGWAPAPTNELQRAIWDELRK